MRFLIYRMLDLVPWERKPMLNMENELKGGGALKSSGESAVEVTGTGPGHYDPFNDYIDILVSGIERHFMGM